MFHMRIHFNLTFFTYISFLDSRIRITSRYCFYNFFIITFGRKNILFVQIYPVNVMCQTFHEFQPSGNHTDLSVFCKRESKIKNYFLTDNFIETLQRKTNSRSYMIKMRQLMKILR